MASLPVYPDGCGDCGGACCVTSGGRPPYVEVMDKAAAPARCIALTDDGLCGIHIRYGYECKPLICRDELVLGGKACLAARGQVPNV